MEGFEAVAAVAMEAGVKAATGKMHHVACVCSLFVLRCFSLGRTRPKIPRGVDWWEVDWAVVQGSSYLVRTIVGRR